MNRTMTKGTNFQRRSAGLFVGAAVVLAGAFAPRAAHAQAWLADRAASEGPGLRLGDFELHPGVGGEVGYDSNWFLRTNKTGAQYANGAPNEPVREAGVFRLTPSLSIGTLSGARAQGETTSPPVTMRANLSATYRAFIGSQEVKDQSSNLSANGDLRVTFAPGRPWSFSVFGSEVRTIQPNSISNQANPDLSYNFDALTVGAELVAQPHSGTLDMRLGYQLGATIFEDGNGQPFNNLLHTVSLKGRWKFRPQTAFVYEGTLGFQSYSDQADQNTELHNSDPVRAKIGLTGLVTPRLSATVLGGWGASFFTPTTPAPQVQQYDSFIANAQLSYNLASNPRDEPGSASLTLSSITLGYNRDFQNSYLSDYYGIDRGYLKFSYMFAGRLLVSLEGGAGAIEYPRVYYTPLGGGNTNGLPIHDPFTDARVDGTLFAEYRFLSSLGVNATFNYSQNFSSTELPIAGSATAGNTTPLVYDMAWRRVQAYLGVRWFL
jgi:hypothetical protein